MSVFIGVLYWVATLVLVLGVLNKVRVYWVTPAPLKIPTTPAPVTKGGVAFRMFREVFLFQSLFRSSKMLWLLAIAFHYGLLLVLLRHFRYFVEGGDGLLNSFIMLVQPFGKYAAFLMLLGLIGLLARRFLIDRVRYISAPSDFAMLLLLIGIAVSGMLMSFVSKVETVLVQEFFIGLRSFEFRPLPDDMILLAHLLMVALLMLIFPISKLLHAPGVFFSPSRNQVDNPREKRHIAAWAKELDTQDKEYLDQIDKT